MSTTSIDADGKITKTEYIDAAAGIGPQHGLPVRNITDPGGLNLVESTGYEPIGSGYLRQATRTLPAGPETTTTSEYYGATETRDNPCTAVPDPTNQGGLQKRDIAADPDGSGPQQPIVRETVYDTAGRTVAERVGTEPWTCVRYDGRGRVTRVDYPAFGGQPARSVTTNYAADPDGAGPRRPSPFVTATTDSTGVIVSEANMVGQVVSYSDVWGKTTTFSYDQAGRETGSDGPAGAIDKSYDAADRVTGVARGGQTLADNLTYDSAGRLTSVRYPTGTGNAGNGTTGTIGYDAYGRISSLTWRGPDDSLITSDEITRRLDGNVIGQVTDGVDHHPGDDYAYDSAGRLVDAWVPGARYNYSFEPNPWCVALNSYRNTNRTSQTVTPTGGTPTTTGYCYDHADRLYYANDPTIGSVEYDAHGNATQIFGETRTYDAVDRHVSTTNGNTTVTYVRDATDRVVERRVNGQTVARYGSSEAGDAPEYTLDTNGTVVEVTLSLPGGVLLTTRSSGNVWSYPNTHGDHVTTTNQAGVKQGVTTVYDPFGNVVNGSLPDNSAGSLDYGWLGQYQRAIEHEPTLEPIIEMGARQYSPRLGRFLEVDPIQGGSANAYDYVNADPVNSEDISGLCGPPGPCILSRTRSSTTWGRWLGKSWVGPSTYIQSRYGNFYEWRVWARFKKFNGRWYVSTRKQKLKRTKLQSKICTSWWAFSACKTFYTATVGTVWSYYYTSWTIYYPWYGR